MRRILIRGGIILAAFFIFCSKSNAQVIELACPIGTTSLQALQTTDTVTGKIRQNYCVDVFGNVTENITGTSNISNINNIRFANQFLGVDLGAQITAADISLGATSGQIWVTASGIISTNVTLSTNHDLVCAGDQVVITMSTLASTIIPSSNTRIRNCSFSSTLTSIPTANGEIVATGVSNVSIENATFTGGGQHIFFNTVSNFLIQNTRHVSLTAQSSAVILSLCDHGNVIGMRVEPFTMPTSASSSRLLKVDRSSFVNVVSPVMQNVDATTIPTFCGVDFAGANNSSLTGGVISGLKNGDGVCTEGDGTATIPASDITVTGVTSTGNGQLTGAGANANTGDGIDIFNSLRVKVANSNFRNNGTQGTHLNCEIQGGSYQVVIVDSDCSDGGYVGVSATGSPKVQLVHITASRNQRAGALFQDAGGTVNTSGTTVTWVSGTQFGLGWTANTKIVINGSNFLVSSVQSTTSLTLTTSAGSLSGVTYSVSSYAFEINGGEYNGNGLALLGAQKQEGIVITGGATDGIVMGVTAGDEKAAKTQTYGLRLDNTARAVVLLDNFRNNLTGTVLDNVGLSPQLNDNGSDGSLANATGSFNIITNLVQTASASMVFNTNVAGRDLIFQGNGTTQLTIKGTGGIQAAGVLSSTGTAATLSGTGACATFGANNSGSFAGSSSCASATAASTLTITFSIAAAHGYNCNVQDETTRANLFQQTSHSTTTCVLTATSVTQNDIFTFSAIGF